MSSEDAVAKNPSTGSVGSASGRSSGRASRQQQSAPQQLSTIEKSVTHLLVATKQLLETLTHWSRGTSSEGEVSDVYVRLGYEFNIACRAFNSIGVDTADLGPVPDLLRSILEETLSQEASQASLDRFLPRIRDIIINLLHGLKKKQQRLRQRASSGSAAQGSRQTSTASNISLDSTLIGSDPDSLARQSSSRSFVDRVANGDLGGPDLPPRSTSVQGGRSSPRRETYSPSSNNNNNSSHHARDASRDTLGSNSSSLSSNAMQNIPVIAPYPQDDNPYSQDDAPYPQHDVMPSQPTSNPPHDMAQPPRTHYSEDTLPPPPPPPKQQDALAALQRGGELERRASRRFSAYQISKHLGSTNGVPMIPPAQHSPIPNRGRDTRESLKAVRTRSIYQSGRQKPSRINSNGSPKRESPADKRISEESSDDKGLLSANEAGSPIIKTPEDKLGPYPFPTVEKREADANASAEADAEAIAMAATVNGPMPDPMLGGANEEPAQTNGIRRHKSSLSRSQSKPQILQQSTSQPQFVPEASPQPGKELTLFLQYKSKIKKFVLPDGADLSIPRLQLAFIEKFAWNTHSNGNDLPEIYLQDPVSGVRHELEDLADVKDRTVLVLNVEQLDEVKRHFDQGLGGIRQLIEGLQTSVVDHNSALQRLTEKQQESAKEIATIAAVPRTAAVHTLAPGSQPSPRTESTASQLDEVQSLRRDLAVIRQTYTSFVDDINASMSTIRTKASSVKAAAQKATVPSMSVDAGRAYVNAGKEGLENESQKLVDRVDDLQDVVEDLRKDVVTRGVRPLPHQLDSLSKDISGATAALRKMQEYLKREKPVWSKIWEKELQVVCDDRELLTMQEDLCMDLEDDLAKAAATYALVEEATRQQNAQNAPKGGTRITSRNLIPLSTSQGADPHKAKDGVLGEVRALQPNHESRLEAIERAEKARKRELESRRGGAFQKELGSFVDEGKLKKTGGIDEIERQRRIKDERSQKENWERAQARERERAAKAAEKARQEAAAKEAAANEATPEAEAEATPNDDGSNPAPVEAAAESAEPPVENPTEESAEHAAKEPSVEEEAEPEKVSGEEQKEEDEGAVTNGESERAAAAADAEDKAEIAAAAEAPEDLASPEGEFSDAKELPPTPAAE